jgi:hypothetical protein
MKFLMALRTRTTTMKNTANSNEVKTIVILVLDGDAGWFEA